MRKEGGKAKQAYRTPKLDLERAPAQNRAHLPGAPEWGDRLRRKMEQFVFISLGPPPRKGGIESPRPLRAPLKSGTQTLETFSV